MTKKTIIVTGGCGYIGSHVTKLLSEAGYQLVVLDNLSNSTADSLLYGETLLQIDLADVAKVDEVFANYQVELLIHFAASIAVDDSVLNPLEYYDNNAVNSLRLIQLCKKHGVRQFVYSSTAAVYGLTTAQPVSETAPTQAIHPYGRSKLMVEWALQDFARADPRFRYVILRYFNVAGAESSGRLGQRNRGNSHLIKAICETALGLRPELHIYGSDYPTPDGTCIRDYIHIDDLASAHIEALSYLSQGGMSQVFNCGYGKGYSVLDVIESFARVSGQKIPYELRPRRAGDVACVVADPAKIKAMTSWQPKCDDIELILRSALKWERQLIAEQSSEVS